MGSVPVAPISSRILFEGDKSVKGFAETFKEALLNRTDIANRETLTAIITLTILFGFKENSLMTFFFHQEPGRCIPQYGQQGSSRLISFLQFGHRIDRRSELFIIDSAHEF